MKFLIIIRGPSGSGKSSIAEFIGGIKYTNWFEADHFFEADGEYKFDKTQLGRAHHWCKENVLNTMKYNGCSVIVSNTGTRLSEIKNYLELAKKHGYRFIIIRTPKPWHAEKLAKRTKHKVPLETIKAQIDRYVEAENETEWNIPIW